MRYGLSERVGSLAALPAANMALIIPLRIANKAKYSGSPLKYSICPYFSYNKANKGAAIPSNNEAKGSIINPEHVDIRTPV